MDLTTFALIVLAVFVGGLLLWGTITLATRLRRSPPVQGAQPAALPAPAPIVPAQRKLHTRTAKFEDGMQITETRYAEALHDLTDAHFQDRHKSSRLISIEEKTKVE